MSSVRIMPFITPLNFSLILNLLNSQEVHLFLFTNSSFPFLFHTIHNKIFKVKMFYNQIFFSFFFAKAFIIKVKEDIVLFSAHKPEFVL